MLEVGWMELVALPELPLPAIKVKVDTGARTSALHATDLERFEKEGEEYARFATYPMRRSKQFSVQCEAPIIGDAEVKNSGGQVEVRPVIVADLCIADQVWPIQLTLTDRSEMRFNMLLGREAMREKITVNPALRYVHGSRSHQSMLALYGVKETS